MRIQYHSANQVRLHFYGVVIVPSIIQVTLHTPNKLWAWIDPKAATSAVPCHFLTALHSCTLA
jgi:hypothetical protein